MTRLSINRLLSLAVAAASLLAGTYMSAQTKAIVRVPFTFTANHQTFPPGEYKLELLSDRFLCFTNNGTGKHQGVIMVQPNPVAFIESRGSLRFVVSDYRHYLMEVRFAGSSMHSAPVIQSSLSRELAKQNNAGTPVEIAMR